MAVNTEHSFQRLSSYTQNDDRNRNIDPEVRHRIANEVTNKFAQDSFMRFAYKEDGKLLFRALRAGRDSRVPPMKQSAGSLETGRSTTCRSSRILECRCFQVNRSASGVR